MLRPLTALRFFAALLVFAEHCPSTEHARWYRTGPAGVEFFFILSGFILTYVHPELFSKQLDGESIKAFWVARFARIYPVYGLAFVLTMCLVVHAQGLSWISQDLQANMTSLIMQLTATKSWAPTQHTYFDFNTASWSISDEVYFYAVFPIVAFTIGAFARPRAIIVLVLLGALCWASSFAIAVHAAGDGFAYFFPPARLLDFLVGICLGKLFVNRGARKPKMSYLAATFVEVFAVAGIVAAIAVTPAVYWPLQHSVWIAPFSAAVIYVFAIGEGALSKLLSTAGFVHLGEISYNFFMLHALFLVIFFDYAGTTSIVIALLALLFCVAVGTIVFELYEKPLRERIRDLSRSSAQRVTAGQANLSFPG